MARPDRRRQNSPDTITANSWQMIYNALPTSEARLREEVGRRAPLSGGLDADALVPPPPLGLPSMQREPASAAPPPVQHKEPAAASPTDYGGSDPLQSAPDHDRTVLTWDLGSGRDGWAPATIADLRSAQAPATIADLRSAQAAAALRRRQSSQERRRRGVRLVSTERMSSFEFAFQSAVQAMKRFRMLRTASWGNNLAALQETGASDDKSFGLRSASWGNNLDALEETGASDDKSFGLRSSEGSGVAFDFGFWILWLVAVKRSHGCCFCSYWLLLLFFSGTVFYGTMVIRKPAGGKAPIGYSSRGNLPAAKHLCGIVSLLWDSKF
jgi:hypothetical protein